MSWIITPSKMLNNDYDWILWLDLINHIPWFNLISSILRCDLICFGLWSALIKSYYLIRFKFLTQLLLLSPPRGRWRKTPPIALRRILLVRPRTHVKYTRTVHPHINGSFNDSNLEWPCKEIYTKLELVSYYLPLAQRLL